MKEFHLLLAASAAVRGLVSFTPLNFKHEIEVGYVAQPHDSFNGVIEMIDGVSWF